MGRRADATRVIPPPAAGSDARPSAGMSSLEIHTLDPSSPFRRTSEATQLAADARSGLWRTVLVYFSAGLAFAVIMTACFLASTGLEFFPLRVLVLFWLYAWPAALAVYLVAGPTGLAGRISLLPYFALFLLLVVAAGLHSSTLGWADLPKAWLIYNLGPTALLALFLTRRIRAVGPLVFTFLFLAVTGSNAVLTVISGREDLLRRTAQLGFSLGLTATSLFVGLIVVGFVAFGVIGWVVLRWIGRRYERKQITDQSVVLDAAFLLFGLSQAISLVFERPAWILSGFLAFAGYKLVATGGFAWLARRGGSRGTGRRLLLLRVFSLGRRSERLFDTVGACWRHVGSLRLIAGPDLATTTIEPHEFLDFLGGKLARRFIDGPVTLDLRLNEMDETRDRDGRFRVTDFFCHDDTWRMVLSRLVQGSEVVLMDLRGFSSANAGCRHEITELVQLMPLERVVFLIDHSTDEGFLRQTIQESWTRLRATSPNRLSPFPTVTLFRLVKSRSGDLQQLLRVLCAAATPAPLPAAPARSLSRPL
jgi:hypothetical protein